MPISDTHVGNEHLKLYHLLLFLVRIARSKRKDFFFCLRFLLNFRKFISAHSYSAHAASRPQRNKNQSTLEERFQMHLLLAKL